MRATFEAVALAETFSKSNP